MSGGLPAGRRPRANIGCGRSSPWAEASRVERGHIEQGRSVQGDGQAQSGVEGSASEGVLQVARVLRIQPVDGGLTDLLSVPYVDD